MPVCLTIAGSDPSGGAGAQADLATFAALGARGASVLTAVTAQNTTGVLGVFALPAAWVAAQIDAVFDDLDVAAVKVGMLGNLGNVEAVAERLAARRPAHVVLDPVLSAAGGEPLLGEDAIGRLIEALFPLATLVTPNLPEAARLAGRELPEDPEAAARAVLDLGARAVLLKGGHRDGADVVDELVSREGPSRRFSHPRAPGPPAHGTGCALSSAVTAGLAGGLGLADAVGKAIFHVEGALRAAFPVGKGSLVLDPFWRRRI
ncbi:MAG: bifunctional hydroxymethylpyrimidine kinase/phosphomethylpyrimidine kinase [Planctomycetes bacterium]|nr:bifunctional hydroxymethylpyrimidine kinase/phosphomethylpyrimidine kinase [Planctomycetota bacterium]